MQLTHFPITRFVTTSINARKVYLSRYFLIFMARPFTSNIHKLLYIRTRFVYGSKWNAKETVITNDAAPLIFQIIPSEIWRQEHAKLSLARKIDVQDKCLFEVRKSEKVILNYPTYDPLTELGSPYVQFSLYL